MGTLYATTGGNVLYSVAPDLSLNWTNSLGGTSSSPPVLTANGTLVVASDGTGFHAYQSNMPIGGPR